MKRKFNLFILGTLLSAGLAYAQPRAASDVSQISCSEVWAYPWNLRVDLKKVNHSWIPAEVKTVFDEEYGDPQVSQMKYFIIDSVTELQEGSVRILKVLGEGLTILIDVTHDLSLPSGNNTLLKNWFPAHVSVEIAQSKAGESYKKYGILCYVN